MKFTVNNIEYQIDCEKSIFEFLRENKIFLPSCDENLDSKLEIDLAYVEIEGIDEVVNAKKILIEEGMSIFTKSKKVHTYLYNLFKEKKIEIKQQYYKKIVLNPNEYNILLCQPECYNNCVDKYQNMGFNDIISTKIAQMLVAVEISNELLNIITKKLNNEKHYPTVLMLQSILNLSNDLQFDIKPSEEILAQLIKGYYKHHLKINKKINIIYVTKSIIGLITHNFKILQYNSLIDDVVYNNNFEVESIENQLDNKISQSLYKVDSINLNTSCNYNALYLLLKQMGFSEETLEVSTTELGKELISGYKGFNLSILITDKFLTDEQIRNLEYDFIVITTRKQTIIANDDEGFLNDYNLNQLYRKILIRPAYSNIFKRGV